MSDHAKLSPSGAPRYLACTASVNKIEKVLKDAPEKPSNPAAIDGTHSHHLLEQVLIADDDPSVYDFIGETLTDHEGSFEVDKERADRVKVALDFIDLATKGEDVIVHSERKVHCGWLSRNDDLDGTADVIIESKKYLHVIDYKDGRNPVNVEDNYQLRLYALGAINEFGGTDIVRMSIVQPRIENRPEEIKTVFMKVSDLLDWYETDVVTAIGDMDNPDIPPIAGNHCLWCAAKGNCSAFKEQTMKDATDLFAAPGTDMVVNEELTDEEVVRIIGAEKRIIGLIKAVKEEALRRMEKGVKIEGLKVIAGRGTQSWNQDEEAMIASLKAAAIPKSAMFNTKLISPAMMQKLTWKNTKNEVKVLSDRKIKTLTENFVKKSAGGHKVVLESDKGKEITFESPEELFADVTTSTDALPDWLS